MAGDENGGLDFPAVDKAESGQKMLQFLKRRLGLPAALLHRWLRTGQIRLNGRRVRPFDRIAAGDIVRLPPFAGRLAEKRDWPAPAQPLEFAGKAGDIWAVCKPKGLPVQPGTGHDDCVLARLAAQFAALPYPPVPAHRLDRDTTGVLLCAASHEALLRLHEAFRTHTAVKEYLAWVEGRLAGERLLRHHLARQGPAEKMLPAAEGALALCFARPLASHADASLLHIRLFTGRRHQIRAQLAALGHPLLGDVKYGAGRRGAGMLLHCLRIGLPGGPSFTCPAPWTGGFAAPTPEPLEIPPDALARIAAAGPRYAQAIEQSENNI